MRGAAQPRRRGREMASSAEDMQVVVTMAGLGSRFRSAGYNVPKYMIQARDRTLFEWSVESLGDYLVHASRCLFVVRAEDRAGGFIRRKSAELSVPDVDLLELDAPTDGQATTCLLACDRLDPELPLMVYNVDTYVEPGGLLFADVAGEGHIPCFRALGDHWSFARVAESGKVVEVREKRRISDLCSLGAYYFSSVGLFCGVYGEYYADPANVERGERYIAPLYNHMISKGLEVTVSDVPAGKVHCLGTPEELQEFIATDLHVEAPLMASYSGEALNPR